MINIIVSVFVLVLLIGCESKLSDYSHIGYEDGLRVGYADKKSQGYCDQPFPKERPVITLYHSDEYLAEFERGYYKGCGVARKSNPPQQPKRMPVVLPHPRTRCN